jgi:UDP-N-acetylglucosamine--N-acetylmuramyl-(pentapeptide) pyrophosphoryl-undecaprenol N-acetylglucosamine transferase
MKIIVTGGHLSPALALIDTLKEKKTIQIVYVGKKYNLDSEKTLSLEYQEIKKRNLPFYHLTTGRLTRIISVATIVNLLKFPFGLLQSFSILKKEKPDLIFSFGGYLGLPVALCGFLLNIPIYIHEQTINPGLTNRILSLFARRIFISFPQTKNFFPKNKVILSGNLVRREIFKIIKKPFVIKKTKPVIYITGGSLGSHSLNILIEKILPQLTKKYIVIHQVGSVEQYHDFERLKTYQYSSYFPVKHFFLEEIGYIYKIADLVIGRAGANTFFELIALKKPAILIPLPWSANQEQQKHALLFKKLGLGETFDQNNEPEQLLFLIDKMMANLNFYLDNFSRLTITFPLNAAEKIIKEIF